MSGQMTLFDLVPEEEKQDYEIRLPQLEEYSKEIKLGFEKEVLGIYLTGHPLEEYEEQLAQEYFGGHNGFCPG